MKKLCKLVSLALAVLMCAALVPFSAAAETAVPSARKMTEAERAAAIDEVIAFSAKLGEMRNTYGADYAARKDMGAYAMGRIVVKAKDDIDSLGALAEVTGHNDWHVLQYASPEEAEAACKQIALQPGVVYAVPDTIMHVEETGEADRGNFHSWGYGPNYVNADSFNNWITEYYGGVENIPQVTVAVIDTGADMDHPFIASRLVPGYDFSNNDADPADDHYHGTHVAGIVTDGTLQNVKIMPIKVLDSTGYGETVTVTLGIEYAYLHGCDVENMSLGGDCDGLEGPEHIMMRDAIYASVDAGTVVCVAAGNETDVASNHCPANVDRALTVASITRDYELSYFSNYGSMVDIQAPGSDVSSANEGGGFATHSGTSMACPHAAAACAMLKSYDINMSPDDVMNTLKGSAVDIDVDNAGTGMLCVTDLLKFDQFVNEPGQNNHFTSTTQYPWQVENGVAVSGNAGHNSSVSTLECTTELRAYQLVTFRYKISSEAGHDVLRFKADGETLFEISGEHDWQTASVTVPVNGRVKLEWEYSKDSSGAVGEDRAYVDNVRIDHTLSSLVNAADSSEYFTSSGAYPWTADAENGAARSGNAGVHYSSSYMSASVRLQAGMKFSFDYRVSCASGDRFSAKVNGGTVLNSAETNGWQTFEYTAQNSGVYSLEFVYTKDGSGSSGSDCAWVRNFTLINTFDSAASGSDYMLPFVNIGAFSWVVEGDHVKSGNAGRHSTTSAFSLNLEMQAGETLTFRYAVSSESNYDFFRFYADNVQKISESGEIGWREYTFTATQSKTYSFRWSYEKDSSVSSNDDCARVDDIVWSGGQVGLLGDVDMSGTVNANDALLLLRYALGLLPGSELDLTVADADGSGTVNANDALLILRVSLGLLTL